MSSSSPYIHRGVLAVLVALVIASLVPLGTEGKDRDLDIEGYYGDGMRFSAPVVPVTYYTNATVAEVGRQAWNDLQAAVPPGSVTFDFRHGPEATCGAVFALRNYGPKQSVSVCIQSDLHETKGASGIAHLFLDYSKSTRRLGRVVIIYDDVYAANLGLHCHEGMHAISGALDDYHSSAETSCVHGHLNHPGPDDITFLSVVYGEEVNPGKDRQKKSCQKKHGARKTCKKRR